MTRFPAILVAVALLAGCATYTDELQPVRDAAVAGRTEAAVDLLNERLDVDSAAEVPAELDEQDVLWLLERGALVQALGDYERSARDLALADQNLEVLDVTRAKATDLARYFYSDDAVTYRAPTYERLLLNTLNMVNYLALGNYEGARVEARRFRVFEDFAEDSEDRKALAASLSLGNWAAGLTFELSGDYGAAVRHYARAYALGHRDGDLRDRLVALVRTTGFTPADGEGEGLGEVLAAAKERGPMDATEYRETWVEGQVVAVLQTGWVPYRVPERVGLADLIFWAGLVTKGPHLSDAESRQVGKLLAEGVVKWVNFPVLVTAGLPAPAAPAIAVDGQGLEPGAPTRTAEEAVAAYEREKGVIAVSAITRLLTRFAAGKATEAVIEHATEKKGKKRESGEIVGWLAGLLVEGTLAALDKPDTRGWTMLPGEIRVVRTTLPPGEHRLVVTVRGSRDERTVRMTPRGVAVLNFSRLR